MDDLVLRLIERTISRLGTDRFIIAFSAPTGSNWIRHLLQRFPNIGVIVKDHVEGLAAADSVRVGYFVGPEFNDWQMPELSYRHVLIIGSPMEVRLRAVRTAILHRVRRFVFADPIDQTLSSKWAVVFIGQLGSRRVWNRLPLIIERILGLNRYPSFPWSKPFHRAFAGISGVERMQRNVMLRQKRLTFHEIFEKLEQFSSRERPNGQAARQDCVVFVIGTVGPGGSERQVVNTALAMAADKQLRPIVACTNLGGGVSEFYRSVLESRGIEVIDLKKIDLDEIPPERIQYATACHAQLANFGYGLGDDIFKIILVLLEKQPVILHSFLDDTNIKAGLAGILVHLPRIILSMRSVAPINFPLHTPIMKPGYEILLNRREVVASCNSVAGAKDYRRWLGRAELPIKIIENGVDFDQFAPRKNGMDRAKFGIPDGKLVLGAIMRLTEEKQPLLWARVVVEISRQMPDVHFVLVGDGPMWDEVAAFIANSRVAIRVQMLGHIKDIPAVLSCFDLLVLTSRLEGSPNVLIEAQAMGVPVVTTPAGGAPETLDNGRTGLVAPDHTVQGIVQACLRILTNDELRTQLSQAAPDYVRNKFSVQRMLRKTLELYAS